MSNNITLYTPKENVQKYLDISEKQGKQLYKDNSNYKALANMMEHPEFRDFYNKYLTDWDSIKTIVMFLKLYEKIENTSTLNLNGFQKLSILDTLIKDKDIRTKIITDFSDQIDNNINLLKN